MRRLLLAVFACVMSVGLAAAEEKGESVTLGNMKSTAPATWKSSPTTSEMRAAQFALPKVEGDPEDAEVVVFYFKGGSGSVEQNLKRQEGMFDLGDNKDAVKVTKTKVGPVDATYQEIKGTYLSKFPPFAPNAKITRKDDYRQSYVVFTGSDGEYYVRMRGPAKTVEKYKAGFDEWLKNFK